ncbi:MAG: hypothetical protein VR69_00865 [Peptococcaceae bacterium BRH_c4b]|nr:MAG: hypothetical protein VR69_00865 [Peptococcaceae bacterium BRH_c4b]
MTQNQLLNGNRFERRKEETKKRIIRVAMDLFKQQGLDSTTMEQIANEADIAKKTLYNHFSAKEEIIVEYVHRMVREQWPEIRSFLQEQPDTRSRLLEMFRGTFEWMERNKEISRIYLAYRLKTVFQSLSKEMPRSGVQDYWIYIILLGQEAGEIRQDVPVETLVSHLDSIRSSTAFGWLFNPEKFPLYESIVMNVDLFLNGAKT